MIGYSRALRMVVAVLVCGLAAVLVPASAAPVPAKKVLSAVVLQMARFVEWPPGILAAPESDFQFCVAGDSRLALDLEDAVAGERIGGHTVSVRRVGKSRELEGCRVILFGAETPAGLMDPSKPVLTIGSQHGFIESGGMVELSVDQGKVSFQLNVTAAEKAGLRFSSRVLALAQNLGRKAGQ